MTDPRETWSLDREIVLSAVIDAPRQAVFAAYADPAQLSAWYGPEGFAIETAEVDIRAGGRWRFVMVGPDGTRWDNRAAYLEVAAPSRLVFDHGRDLDDDPTRFRVTVTFDSQSDGKTVVTARQLHPTAAQREATIGFGAVEYGYQTFAKLAEHLANRKAAA